VHQRTRNLERYWCVSSFGACALSLWRGEQKRHNLARMNMTTLPLKHSMNRSHLRVGFLSILLAVVCFPLATQAQATCQEGCLTNQNTVFGDDALLELTTGMNNTAVGFEALLATTAGNWNTATGAFALALNTTGTNNTATGVNTLVNNTTGIENTANGVNALHSNTTGNDNTAIGDNTLVSNTTGNVNTATGANALQQNTTGTNNTGIGVHAIYSNTTGDNNTAIGLDALIQNTTGSNNIALGYSAGQNVTTGGNNIDIGNLGVAGDFKTIRIGTARTQRATFIAGIAGAAVTGSQVIVNPNGKLGVTPSSARFKERIKPMNKQSEAILGLKPVTFHYKKELDPNDTPQFGLVAEEVDKVNPDLVARDDQGKPYTVRYEAVNAMLLNEFLKEHRTVQQQGAIMARLEKQVERLTADLQKVSAQLELE